MAKTFSPCVSDGDDDGRPPAQGRGVVQRRDGRQLRQVTIYLPREVARLLMVHCAEQDVTLSDTVALAVQRLLASNE